MTDLFKHIHLAWRANNAQNEEIGSLCSYLVEYSSLGDIDLMFCALRDELNASPCCARHTGALPISVNSMQDTPFVGGYGCDRGLRHHMRILRRAYMTLMPVSSDEQFSAVPQEEPELHVREL